MKRFITTSLMVAAVFLATDGRVFAPANFMKTRPSGSSAVSPPAAFVLPRGRPKNRVQIIRRAFMETMKHPEFLAEAKEGNLDINPTDGAARCETPALLGLAGLFV